MKNTIIKVLSPALVQVLTKVRLVRLWPLILLNILLLLGIAAIAPNQIAVTGYKLLLAALAGLLGYWLDRWVFFYARPLEHWKRGDTLHNIGLMLRRAIIMGSVILAVGLGL